jgi:hypothetical protein
MIPIVFGVCVTFVFLCGGRLTASVCAGEGLRRSRRWMNSTVHGYVVTLCRGSLLSTRNQSRGSVADVSRTVL